MRLKRPKLTLLIPIAGGFTLIFLILTQLQTREPTPTKTGPKVNRSWSMEYRVIHETSILNEHRPVLIIVTSAPGNLKRRMVIRETWGSWPNMRVVFIIGVPAVYDDQLKESIEQEVSTHGDILQLDFHDAYRNLTLKSCAIVMWAVRNSWPERKVVVKTDDDMCVNMPLLTSILEDFHGGIYGHLMPPQKPYRCNRTACSKWGLTLEEYPEERLPPYVIGNLYVIEEHALKMLHDMLFVPKFLFIEDVYLTGLVARAANVSIASMPKGVQVDGYWAPPDWKKRKNLVAQHLCNETFQREFWDHTFRLPGTDLLRLLFPDRQIRSATQKLPQRS